MSLRSAIRSIVRCFSAHDEVATAYEATTSPLSTRLLDTFLRTADLGLTSFGGPNVHFQIFHRRFVEGVGGRRPWIDEQTYQELFAISQASPGPASTKMLFNIAQIHAGVIPAILVILIWSLPAGIVMYGLALGVSRIEETLPGPVYALLSGLNAATVGLIALAAVQLARKAIIDKLTRLLVLFGACAGMCYGALWYFPVLLVFGGLSTFIWDIYGRAWVARLRRRHSIPPERESGSQNEIVIDRTTDPHAVETSTQRKRPEAAQPDSEPTQQPSPSATTTSRVDISAHRISVKTGLILIILFSAAFTIFMVLRGTLHPSPPLLAIFNNMLLAGTIIFGGGPVVIPLLRNYVVDPGWVSPRDFLLGLAIIQAMPGPNFNFAVYLGALAVSSASNAPSVVGAVLAYLGIFSPGLWISLGLQSIWQSIRKRQEVTSILRGVNATAVGLVFTAVYRLWEIGYLTASQSNGTSLAQEPWWLVIATTTYSAVEWFSAPPPVAIVTGGVAGLAWYGAVGRHVRFGQG